MRSTFELCLPTVAKTVPSGPDCFHEVKYAGYRLLVIRDHDRVRLITRGGHGWSKRYPWIVEAALKNRTKQFVIRGRGARRGRRLRLQTLHSRKHDQEIQLYAFDVIAMDGDDLRPLPLQLRKNNLQRLDRESGIKS